MSSQQKNLINKAKQKYGTIFPCGNKEHWSACFTVHFGALYFWFNDLNNSTHVEIDKIDE